MLKNKTVCLFSGGIDSTTLLYYLINQVTEVFPLTIFYGQTHKKEIDSAITICNQLNIFHTYLDLSCLKSLLKSALTGQRDIPEGYYTNDSMSQTVVPNRNMIFLSIAAGYALSIKAKSVAYAAHVGDHPIYPDCRPEFVDSVRETIKLGTGDEVDLIEPFVNMTKAEIIALGSGLGVPFELTWSCYKGKEFHCAKCGTCIERIEAFKLAGVKDPTRYKV